jgi:hypothetical protein
MAPAASTLLPPEWFSISPASTESSPISSPDIPRDIHLAHRGAGTHLAGIPPPRDTRPLQDTRQVRKARTRPTRPIRLGRPPGIRQGSLATGLGMLQGPLNTLLAQGPVTGQALE